MLVIIAAGVCALACDRTAPVTGVNGITCEAYEEKINALHELFPAGITAEERCEMTPRDCGATGLIFNPRGMETYYYRSACYAELARSTLEGRHCDEVEERQSLFFDGHFYSREACLDRVGQLLADRSAPKIGSAKIARVDSLEARFDGPRQLAIDLGLVPESPVPGFYAIAATAEIEGPTEVFVALNPQHPAIARSDRYGRLLPISNWILRIDAGRPYGRIRVVSNANQLRDHLARGGARHFTLKIELQFLESADGALPDAAEPRQAYISRRAVRVPL